MRVQNNQSTTLASPFNFGFVQYATGNLVGETPTQFIFNNAPLSGLFQYSGSYTTPFSSSTLESTILANFDPTTYTDVAGANVPSESIVFYAQDFIPTVETKIPAGTYTFHATATPSAGASTPGSFVFSTLSEGVWTTVYSLSLTKAEGDTRTLTFKYDARVRWQLIPTSSQAAQAAIVARYYKSPSS